MPPKLYVISLWAEDVAAATHFYRDVIGLPLLSHHAGRPHFDLGGCYLAILRGKPVSARSPSPERFPLLAWRVEDLDRAVENLKKHAVALPWGIEGEAGERWAMLFDPAGNLIELAE